MVAGLTVLSLGIVDRNARWLVRLRPLVGVPLMAAIVLPWFIAILAIAGRDFIGESVGHDLLAKLGSGQEGHAAPPGTHFALFWFIFWPAAALLPAAAPWIWRERGDPAIRFCLAWLVPSFLVFEAVVTKPPHHPLLTHPAVAASAAPSPRRPRRRLAVARAPAILAATSASSRSRPGCGDGPFRRRHHAAGDCRALPSRRGDPGRVDFAGACWHRAPPSRRCRSTSSPSASPCLRSPARLTPWDRDALART
jgi:hypothetical protein